MCRWEFVTSEMFHCGCWFNLRSLSKISTIMFQLKCFWKNIVFNQHSFQPSLRPSWVLFIATLSTFTGQFLVFHQASDHFSTFSFNRWLSCLLKSALHVPNLQSTQQLCFRWWKVNFKRICRASGSHSCAHLWVLLDVLHDFIYFCHMKEATRHNWSEQPLILRNNYLPCSFYKSNHFLLSTWTAHLYFLFYA